MIEFIIRLQCQYSITDEESPDLICEVTGHKCDGQYQIDLCQPETCYFGDGVCCYPIEDCINCPVRRNERVFTRAVFS